MMGWINIRIILNVTQIEEMMSSLSVLIKICIIKLFAHIYLYVYVYILATARLNWLIFLGSL